MDARWLLLGFACSLLAGCWVKEKEIRSKINVLYQETADTGEPEDDLVEEDAEEDAEDED